MTTFGAVYLAHTGGGVLQTGAEVLDKVHNEYLQVLFEEGLPALAALLAAYGLILWSARRAAREPEALAAALALGFYLVQAVFNIATPFTHPLVWALWGVLAAWGAAGKRPCPGAPAGKRGGQP